MEMKDIKAITVKLGVGGCIAMKFDEKSGQLFLWPNDQAEHAPKDAKRYLLSRTASRWSIFDNSLDVETITLGTQ